MMGGSILSPTLVIRKVWRMSCPTKRRLSTPTHSSSACWTSGASHAESHHLDSRIAVRGHPRRQYGEVGPALSPPCGGRRCTSAIGGRRSAQDRQGRRKD